MSYEILFFYDNRVAILNTTTYVMLPIIYKSLSEFMLLTVLNENEVICDIREHSKIYFIYDEIYNRNPTSSEAVNEIKEYNCKEIPISQIKEKIPSDGATIEYDSSILKVFDSKPGKTSCKIEHYNKNNVLVERYTEKDGLRDGKYEEWYNTGIKSLERNYKDGKKEGLEQRWYDNGKLLSESYYKDSKKNGLCKSWCENGETFDEYLFKDGKLVDNDN